MVRYEAEIIQHPRPTPEDLPPVTIKLLDVKHPEKPELTDYSTPIEAVEDVISERSAVRWRKILSLLAAGAGLVKTLPDATNVLVSQNTTLQELASKDALWLSLIPVGLIMSYRFHLSRRPWEAKWQALEDRYPNTTTELNTGLLSLDFIPQPLERFL